jgi:hypothetical protein
LLSAATWLVLLVAHWATTHTASAQAPGAELPTEASIKEYVDDALRYRDVNGGTINYNVGRAIGTDAAGNPVTGIRVHDGIIRTAFPVAP